MTRHHAKDPKVNSKDRVFARKPLLEKVVPEEKVSVEDQSLRVPVSGINLEDPIFRTKPADWGEGTEKASKEVDKTLYE